MAVYSGDALGNLVPLGWDDDSGGFLTSRVVFRAVQDGDYQIAIDGLNGAAGNLVLNWSLLSTAGVVPTIAIQLQSQSVAPGDDVTMRVTSASLAPLQFQWRFSCSTLVGQTNDTLYIRQTGAGQVGVYSVQVSSAGGSIESERATLQVNLTGGSATKALARDKSADARTVAGGMARRGLASSGPSPRSQMVLLPLGGTGLQIFNTYGAAKEPGEPNHGGIAGGASYWFALQAQGDGVLTLSTEGSDFDTVLAAYTGGETGFISLTPVASDDNGGCDGLTSLARCAATAGTTYYIVVDGVNGTTGTVRLSYVLDAPGLKLSASPPPVPPLPPALFQAQFHGVAGRNYRLQTSADLVHWRNLTTTHLGGAGVFPITDGDLLQLPYRFYRVIPVP